MKLKQRILVATLLVSASSAALADKFYAVTPSGAAESIYAASGSTVSATIARKCMDLHWTVTSSSSTEVVCEAPMNFGQSLLGTLLMGNSYSTPPRRFYKFSVSEIQGLTRVQATGWMELQMAFGQMRRTEFVGPQFQNDVDIFLLAAGGQYPIGTTFPNHARLGITGKFGTAGKQKVYEVTSVEPGAPAQAAGLIPGDKILKIAGKGIKEDVLLGDGIEKAAQASTYTVAILRDDKPLSLEFKTAFRSPIMEGPTPLPQAPSISAPANNVEIADELAKLAKLRSDGILTEQEFQARKTRLLAQ